MCGIAGVLSFKNNPVNEELIRKMTCAMSHRGPDSDGIFVDHEVGLGHRRLSIIDLSTAANQPYSDNSGRFVMVFNGEMYNFKEVRLLLNEYEFKTTGDTEVLVAGFAKWGPDCVKYFKGMFAFAVWDKQDRVLTIVRDRLGVKPLYYLIDDQKLVFASELRAILDSDLVKRKINTAGLIDLLSYQSVGSPLTIIDEITQLEAGTYAIIKNGKINIKTYWNVTKPKVDFDFTDKKNINAKMKALLFESVKSRLVSDVPIGAFLSGGIDSSLIVGLMAEASSSRPNTFNIAFSEREFDESRYAEIIAKKFNTNHTRIDLKPESFLEELENALRAMDTPSSDGINSFVVSKAIRNAGMTVALSGVGGDELFAGYPIFNQYLNLNKWRPLWERAGLIRKLVAFPITSRSANKHLRIKQILNAGSPSIENVYPILRQILAPELISRLTTLTGDIHLTSLSKKLLACKDDLHHLPLLSQVSAAEYMGYTQNTLLKDMDQMSMAVSLEVREPFFDHDLVEFVLSVPDHLKHSATPKGLLIESFESLLPDEIVHRKKQGFLFPWSHWMKRELKSFCETRIQRLSEKPFINKVELIKYWNRFLRNDKSVRWSELWIFVVLQYWLEKNHVNE